METVLGNVMTVALEWPGNPTVTLEKVHFANTFEDQKTVSSDKVKFIKSVRIDSNAKVLTPNVILKEIPLGTLAQVKLNGSKVVLKFLVPGRPLPVDVEMSMISLSMATRPA